MDRQNIQEYIDMLQLYFCSGKQHLIHMVMDCMDQLFQLVEAVGLSAKYNMRMDLQCNQAHTGNLDNDC
jgi:hypothetical protein